MAGKHAACGWALVQMHQQDGGLEPWCDVGGNIADKFRSATDHRESGDLGAMHRFDTEEIFEEMKQRLECQVDQMYKPRLGKAAVGKTLYPRLRCRKRSIYGKVSGIWYGLEFVLVWILMNFGQMKCHETTPGNPTDITAA